MRDRLALLARMFGLCLRLRPLSTLAVVAIMVFQAVSVTALALVQGRLVQATNGGITTSLVVTVCAGALVLVVMMVGHRLMFSLQRDVIEAVEVQLADDLLDWTTAPATVEHLEDPVFLDRLSVVLRRISGLIWALWSVLFVLLSVIAVVVSLTVLARISWWLVGLCLAAIPPILLAGRAGSLYITAIDKNADLLRLEADLSEVLTKPSSLTEVIVSGSGERVDERARQLWDEMAAHELRARGMAVVLTSLGWLIYGLGAGAALWWTIRLATTGRATLGEVSVVAGLAVYLAVQLMSVLNFRVEVADAGRVIDHFVWIRQRTRELAQPGDPVQAIDRDLELQDVGYSYPGQESPVLEGLSLTIPAGTVLGVVGVNGAGKTTLTKLLTGLISPTTGRLLVDGEPVTTGGLARATAGTFQDYAQLELLARESVGVADLGRLQDGAGLDRAAAAGGADAVIRRLDQSWDTQLGATFDGTELSKGQWQRMALARGLFKQDPTLLVLDEPTAALDPQSEHDLFVAFTEHARRLAAQNGAITVLVSHRFSTVTMTDLIVVLDQGRIIEQGSHTDLLAAGGTYRELYEAQAQGYRS